MRLGIDPSSYLECIHHGATYSVDGKPVEPISYLHDENGVDLMRLRLWVDPFDWEIEPYLGGTNDLPTFVVLARKGYRLGYDILLDFHFSDFWADPGKQFLPKAWRDLDMDGLERALGDYVRETLTYLKRKGIEPYAIQLGNEITAGFLWPYGKIDYHAEPPSSGFAGFLRLLSAAFTATREVLPEAKILLHLERSYDQETHRRFFDEVVAAGLSFDLIGLSYYPYWHHGFDELFANVDMLKERYGRPVWIVETAYAHTQEEAYPGVGDGPLLNEVMAEKEGLNIPYPLTEEGQVSFIDALIEKASVHDVEAIFYWEPLWVPKEGISWASREGEEYIHETNKPLVNEWASQCLFDYQGRATKGLKAFSLKDR